MFNKKTQSKKIKEKYDQHKIQERYIQFEHIAKELKYNVMYMIM